VTEQPEPPIHGEETRTGPGYQPTADYRPATEPATVVGGRYKLIERIGEGGMGEVWVAKQMEPVQRKVALKLIKAGMDSKSVLGRFEQERQALAMMDHPNIAKVLDGGLTEAGRPYFVMPLTRFCDDAKLPPRERLELFVPVCHAIQHAHQKGIVHRDLKPTNILVTLYDGRPVPKVIDFGVAKATGGRLTEETLSTQFGAVVGTFEYMAPEQAGFSALDVDTRADVYSLGVIMYELLTGLRPFEGSRLRKAAIDELFRILREEEPPRPSTKLSSDASLASAAAARRTGPKKLAALMRGELDWIVMKCLEKDRSRRYETVSALARDVERYLRDETVEARPPSPGYRARKFIRRNRGRVIAASLLFLVLVAGVIGTTAGLIKAQRDRDAAQRAEQQADSDRAWAVAEFQRAETEGARARAAEFEQGKALKQAETALIRSDGLRLASESSHVRASDPGLALLLGLEGVRRYPHHLTFAALYEAAGDLRERRTIPAGMYGVKGLRVHRDGAKALAFADSGSEQTAAVIDLMTGNRLATWRGLPYLVSDADLSPDGTRAVCIIPGQVTVAFTDGQKPEQATFTDRVAYVWDTTTGRDVVHLRRHDDRVVSARFSRDGTKIVTASWDGTARIWDAVSGKELHVLRAHQNSLLTAVFSPDGKRVLTVSSQTENRSANSEAMSSGRAQDRAANTDPGVTTRPYQVRGTSSAGGSFNLTRRGDNPFARIWDVDTGKQVGQLVLSTGRTQFGFFWNRPQSVAFSPDGQRIAVGFTDDLVGVWDVTGGEERLNLSGHRGQVKDIVFSPDGTELATAGNGSAVILWDLATGKLVRQLKGDQLNVQLVRFSADGRRLVTAEADRTVRVWHASTGREMAVFRGHSGPVTAAHFLPDGETVVTAGDSTLRLWSVEPDPPSGRLATLLGKGPARHTGPVTALIFSPDGQSIYTGSQDRTIRRWDAAAGRQTAAVTELRGSPRSLAIGAKGVLYAATDMSHAYFWAERSSKSTGDRETFLSAVHRWDPATGKTSRFLKGQNTGVGFIELSRDGRRILLSRRSEELFYRPGASNPLDYEQKSSGPLGGAAVWDMTSGEQVCALPGLENAYDDRMRAHFSPDGTKVLYTHQDRNVLALFEASSGKHLRTLAAPTDRHSAEWSATEFSPDGRLIAGQKSGSWDVWFWDAAPGTLLGSFRSPPTANTWSAHQHLAFSPDSKRVAVVADRVVQIVDPATRSAIRELRGHEAPVTGLAFARDGSRLLTGSEDKTAALWDVEAGQLLAVYRGHGGPVNLLAYSPDGTRVATASDSELMARVWPLDVVPLFDQRKPRELTAGERVRYELPVGRK
jgi:WD40 repeat protein